ncbi:hypothetical protein D3C86_1071880 [compost metagenome]
MWCSGMSGFGMLGMVLWGLVALALPMLVLIAVGWQVIPRLAPSEGRLPAPESGAQRILDERYARGEIDDAEYERRREKLHASRPSGPAA